MALVLDASVVLTWALRDERNARGDSLLSLCRLSYSVVPALFPTEVANALLMAERRKRITAAEVNRFLSELSRLDLRIQPAYLNVTDRILSLARAESLTAYDAAYLHLAMQLDLALATFDEALTLAAKERGVPLA